VPALPSDLALQFLGVAVHPAALLTPLLFCLATKRRRNVRIAGALVGAGLGGLEAIGGDLARSVLTVLVSALAGLLAAEIAMMLILPLGLMAITGVLWAVRRLRG